jgi:hypothetical protein
MWVISTKEDALQAISISKDVSRNALTLEPKEIDKTIDCAGDVPVNQSIGSRQFGITFRGHPKGSKLLSGIFPLV